jgi:hypothetical protein
MTQSLVSKTLAATLVAGGLLIGMNTHAQLNLVNGNFEAAPAVEHQVSVTDWYVRTWDPNQFWLATWLESGNSDGTPSLALATAYTGAWYHSWAYQDIGTAAGATSLNVTFDWGTFGDAGNARDLGITWGIYASNGSFTPADGTDVDGAAGMTLLSSFSFTALGVVNDHGFGGANGSSAGIETGTLNLAGAGTSQLFLRVINVDNNGVGDYAWVDNVSINPVPEPASFALAAFGGLALLALRRKA